jgi:hypothetical protein
LDQAIDPIFMSASNEIFSRYITSIHHISLIFYQYSYFLVI